MMLKMKYIALIASGLLYTSQTYAAAALDAHAHAADSEDARGWNQLSSPSIFSNIDLSKTSIAVGAIAEHFGSDSPITRTFSLMHDPITAGIREALCKTLDRLRWNEKAPAGTTPYFTKDKIIEIVSSLPIDESAETIQGIVLTEIGASPLSPEQKLNLTVYLTKDGLLLGHLTQNLSLRDKAKASIDYLRAQAAYCLVHQVALVEKAFDMRDAGGYNCMHDSMSLGRSDLTPVIRNALWDVFVGTGFVTSSIARGTINSFVYNPAEALRDYLAEHSAERTLILGCGSVPKIYQQFYELRDLNSISQFMGSLTYHSSHAGEVTVGLDYRDRPNVFANLNDPSLYSLIPAGRLDRIVFESGSEINAEVIDIARTKLAVVGGKLLKLGYDGKEIEL